LGRVLAIAAGFLINVVVIREIPTFSLGYWLTQIGAVVNFFNAAISLGAAWLLARWVYGNEPFRKLCKYRTRPPRRNNV